MTYLYLIMLNQTLKSYFTKQSGFQSKSVIFVTSIPIPEAPMGRGWADIHMVKGVFVRFGFDAIRISQIQRQVKNKATKNAS